MSTLRPGMRVRLTSGDDLGYVVTLLNGGRCRVRWDGGYVSTEQPANVIPLDPPPAHASEAVCNCRWVHGGGMDRRSCPAHGRAQAREADMRVAHLWDRILTFAQAYDADKPERSEREAEVTRAIEALIDDPTPPTGHVIVTLTREEAEAFAYRHDWGGVKTRVRDALYAQDEAAIKGETPRRESAREMCERLGMPAEDCSDDELRARLDDLTGTGEGT